MLGGALCVLCAALDEQVKCGRAQLKVCAFNNSQEMFNHTSLWSGQPSLRRPRRPFFILFLVQGPNANSAEETPNKAA
jgi:hypothetical protein